ncbi:alkbh8, partial [Symbiodinium sp. CCMP2456]
ELGKVRSSKLKAEAGEKQKALEERDMAVFQEVLPEAVSKANAAEDAVEKAVITSEMITAGGDDMDEVRQAVTSTEQ